MPVRITATLVSRRVSSTILARRAPLGVRCLRSEQAITQRATMALRRDTAQAAAKRRMMVRALSICYKVSFHSRYRQGSLCHNPPAKSLLRLYLSDTRRAPPAADPVRHHEPAGERIRVRRLCPEPAGRRGLRDHDLREGPGQAEPRRPAAGCRRQPTAPAAGPRRRGHDYRPGVAETSF